MEFAIPVPEEMSVSHMALSQDGTMLAFVSPEENSALPMLYVQRIGSSSVTLLAGYTRRKLSLLVAGWCLRWILREWQAAENGGSRRHAASPCHRLGRTRRQLGKQERNHLCSGRAKSAATHQCRWDGNGSSHTEYQDCRGSIPPLAAISSRRRTFLILGRNFGNLKDDRSSGSTRVLSKARKENLLSSAHSSFGYDARDLFYADDQRQLVSIAFDPSAGTVSGSTSVVANAVGFQPSTYWAALTVAQNGTLTYNTGAGAAQSALTWMDRSGKELGRIGDPGVMANPTLSPDGSRVAVDISDPKANNVDIWIESTTGAANSRFTFTLRKKWWACGREMGACWLPHRCRRRHGFVHEADDRPGAREKEIHYSEVGHG